jgi:alkylation response protein AidB-like acyl-CoA dehydrogenase
MQLLSRKTQLYEKPRIARLQTQDDLAQANELAKEFAKTAISTRSREERVYERDKQGGTPKAERERLRESGLLKLIIPKEYGGLGERWTTVLQITRTFAEVDSSISTRSREERVYAKRYELDTSAGACYRLLENVKLWKKNWPNKIFR